jgi:hypothetical protein
MATEGKDLLVKAADEISEAEAFRKFVKRIVGTETEAVLKSLATDGAVIGKKQISRAVGK